MNEDTEFVEESREFEGIGMMEMTQSANHVNGVSQSHQISGNDHLVIDVNKNSNNSHEGHVHSSHCSHSHSNGNVPLGLGIGLSRNASRPAVL